MLAVTSELLVIVVLILINGVLSLAEIALVSSRRIRLQQNAENGGHGAKLALALAEEPTRFLSTTQVGITLVTLLSGVFGGAKLSSRVSGWLIDAGLSESLSDTLAVIGVVIVITYLTIIIGELVPKRVGLSQPERFAALVASPMVLLSKLTRPFVAVLTASTSTVMRLIGLRSENNMTVTEEEIRLMIGMSAESGSVAEAEAELLDRVFHFGDQRVHEVMIPRTEVVWLEHDSLIRDFFETFEATPHSRFPVADDSPDQITGILVIKDVLKALAAEEVTSESRIDTLLRPAFFVPETKLIGDLFREMQERGVQMAIAVDEFGGTAGIVTLESLLEEMVGAVHDELMPASAEITAIDERTIAVDGSLSVDEAREELGIDIPEGPYDTIAGYVLDQLGHIPREGEQLTIDHFQITVAEMRGPKIEQIHLVRT